MIIFLGVCGGSGAIEPTYLVNCFNYEPDPFYILEFEYIYNVILEFHYYALCYDRSLLYLFLI